MLGDTAEHATAITARSIGCSPIATLHSTSTSANRATWILEPRAIDSATPTLFFIALPGRPVLTVLLSVLFSSQARRLFLPYRPASSRTLGQRAGQLVERVVAADILAHQQQAAVGARPAGGMGGAVVLVDALLAGQRCYGPRDRRARLWANAEKAADLLIGACGPGVPVA
jgi:hypothetical protein